MNDSLNSNLNSAANKLLGQRVVEPDASSLAQKIVLASRDLPQDKVMLSTKSECGDNFKKFGWGRLFKTNSFIFTGTLACLMLAVASGILYMPQTATMNAQPIAQLENVAADVLSEEFSWDSLLVMQDELAFAEL